MTDVLEQLLELLEEEETQEAGLRLTPAGPLSAGAGGRDAAAERSASAGRSDGAGPTQDALRGRETARETTRGAVWTEVQETARGAARTEAQETVHKRTRTQETVPRRVGAQAFRPFGGLLAKTVEGMPDALAGGRAIAAPPRWEDGGRYAGVNAAGGAQALERRLAQGAARLSSVPRPDRGTAETVIQTAGPGLEELDRRIRRDARRYDGELTPY